MRFLFFLPFLLLTSLFSISQTTIVLEDVQHHVGDSVKVCGKVYGMRTFESAKNSPTLLNLGAAFPNQLLTVVLWGDVRKQLDKTPEELYKDQKVCITGRIELFKEKPQIVVRRKEDIEK